MNCSAIRTCDLGHICKHNLKINQSQGCPFGRLGKLAISFKETLNQVCHRLPLKGSTMHLHSAEMGQQCESSLK